MASRGKAFAVVVLLTVLLCAGNGFAQASAANGAGSAAASTQPAPAATRAAPRVLTVVPADAWGAVGVNNLQQLDAEVMQLANKLSLPIFFPPSGLVQMALGITQGFDSSGGIGMIFLSKLKYGQVTGWEIFPNLPVPMVLAVSATNPKELIDSMGGKPAEEKGLFSAMVGKQPVVAAVKGRFVLFASDAALVKAVADTGATATATQPVTAVIKPAFARQINGSNLFVMLNVKPIATTFEPMVRGFIATMNAMRQAAKAQGGAASTQPEPDVAAMTQQYYEILTKQVDRLAVLGSLDSTGLTLSGLVTFQPDTLLYKVFAAIKPTGTPLLAGLPDGNYVLAAGGVKTSQKYVKDLAELFTKPWLDAMKASGNPKLVKTAEEQAKIVDMRVQLDQMRRSGHLGVYLLPAAEDGLLTAGLSAEVTDGPKAYALVKKITKAQFDAMSVEQPKVKDFLAAVAYTPDAETVDSMKVDTLLIDVTKSAGHLPQDEQGRC